jgi:hypothetical protein
MDRDDNLINEITSDVLRALAGRRFFELLDDRMCPADEERLRLPCAGTYAISTAVLVGTGFDQEEISDILQVLESKGGCCDCEILYNVAEESRLKAEYWKARAGEDRLSRVLTIRKHGR